MSPVDLEHEVGSFIRFSVWNNLVCQTAECFVSPIGRNLVPLAFECLDVESVMSAWVILALEHFDAEQAHEWECICDRSKRCSG